MGKDEAQIDGSLPVGHFSFPIFTSPPPTAPIKAQVCQTQLQSSQTGSEKLWKQGKC